MYGQENEIRGGTMPTMNAGRDQQMSAEFEKRTESVYCLLKEVEAKLETIRSRLDFVMTPAVMANALTNGKPEPRIQCRLFDTMDRTVGHVRSLGQIADDILSRLAI
jgi:hypothetical protein